MGGRPRSRRPPPADDGAAGPAGRGAHRPGRGGHLPLRRALRPGRRLPGATTAGSRCATSTAGCASGPPPGGRWSTRTGSPARSSEAAGMGGPLVFAHRGASYDLPEHTLAAYLRALDEGADGLECDVRLTRDGHLVCVHDRRLDRTSNGRGLVSARTLAELDALDFGSWHPGGASAGDLPPDESRTRLLTLDRLLDAVLAAGRPVRLLVETKHPSRYGSDVERRLVALLRRYGLAEPAPDDPVQVTRDVVLPAGGPAGPRAGPDAAHGAVAGGAAALAAAGPAAVRHPHRRAGHRPGPGPPAAAARAAGGRQPGVRLDGQRAGRPGAGAGRRGGRDHHRPTGARRSPDWAADRYRPGRGARNPGRRGRLGTCRSVSTSPLSSPATPS